MAEPTLVELIERYEAASAAFDVAFDAVVVPGEWGPACLAARAARDVASDELGVAIGRACGEAEGYSVRHGGRVYISCRGWPDPSHYTISARLMPPIPPEASELDAKGAAHDRR